MVPAAAAALAAARTTTRVLFCSTMPSTSMSASVTLTRDAPWPSRLVPVIVTSVPSCPLAGVTRDMAPGTLYVQAFESETRCPFVHDNRRGSRNILK
jgi:hypothetical protein